MPARLPRLVLASTSPRRLELLGRLGLAPARIVAPDIDETPLNAERPRDYVIRIALAKAAAADRAEGEVILAGDTTIAVGRSYPGQARGRGGRRADAGAIVGTTPPLPVGGCGD